MSLVKATTDLEQVENEVEKLREECRLKTELSESLRKSHADQLARIQHANMEVEKLARELNVKSEEICDIRGMYDELQSILRRKDLFVEQISSANESLRVEYGEKILKLAEANTSLVSALDEASARIQDLERKTCASDEQIACLKRFISEKSKKGVQVENGEQKDLKERELYILKLEEEGRVVKEQLKWKDEQFSHLEEALDKLQTRFRMGKVEWQKDKSALVDEISSVQATLDAEVRLSQSLETQLRMCNQALVHEESRRKFLELELSEFRSRHDNVFTECQEVKSEIVQLTMKKDEEIAELRSLLRKKDIILTEMIYKLEQENSNILVSMKDLQQTELNDSAESCSSDKLRKELYSLKRVHNKCAANMKKREDECNLQIEQLKGDLRSCSSELEGKNGRFKEACAELEDAKYLLTEENFVSLMVLTSEFNFAYLKLQIANENLETSSKQIEETNVLLEQQLEIKTTEVSKVHDELKRHKEMLENAHIEHKIKNSDALDMAKVELINKASEVEKYKLEIMKWKTDVDHLKLKLAESQQLHEQENENLAILKDQNAKNSELHEQVRDLKALLVEKMEVAEILKLEKDAYMQITEERNCSTESLKNELSQLKVELARNEARYLDLVNKHKTLEQEMVRLLANTDEKDRKAQELNQQVENLDQKLKSAMISFAEKESLLDESLNRAIDQHMLQIEVKNQTISNMEKNVKDLCKHLEFQEKTATELKQEVLHLEASSKAKNAEIENLKSQSEKERKQSEDMLDGLKAQKEALLGDLKKTSNDREYLLSQLDNISALFEVFCKDDVELMVILKKMCLSEEGLNQQ